MVALSDIIFQGRVGRMLRGIPGSSITGLITTIAEGLAKAGNIDIDASGDTTRTVVIRNSTVGQVANVSVDGNVDAAGSVRGADVISLDTVILGGGTAYGMTLGGTPTADRSFDLPDITGDVLVRDSGTGTVPFAGSTRFDAPDAGSNTAFALLNSEAGRVANLIVQGAITFFTDFSSHRFKFAGSPTANRDITIRDANVTVCHHGTLTYAQLLSLTTMQQGDTAYVSDGRSIVSVDINGNFNVQAYGHGTGVLVSFTDVPSPQWNIAGTLLTVSS